MARQVFLVPAISTFALLSLFVVHSLMSFSGYGAADSPSWGVTSPPAGDLVRDALRKEQLIKCVHITPLRGSLLTVCDRDIAASQEDLRSPSDFSGHRK